MAQAPDAPPREADRLIYAGLLGLAAAAVIQLSDNKDLDIPQFVEVCSFAAAIPLLAVGLVTDFARREGAAVPRWRDGLSLLGCCAAVVGLGALFFHFHPAVGSAFAGLCVAGFLLVRSL